MTIAYFLHDQFFVPIMYYLKSIEDYEMDAWLSYYSGRRLLSHSQHFSLDYVEDHNPEQPPYLATLDPDEIPDEDIRAKLLELLIKRFCDKYSGTYKDKDFASYSTRYKKRKGMSFNIIDEEVLYRVYLCYNLIEIVGFEIFKIDSLRDSILYCEACGLDDLLTKVTNKLSFGSRNRKKRDKYFLFALCEKLKQNKFGTRNTFKIVAKYLYYASSSVHRRYYEIQNELNEKNYSVEEVIRIYKLEGRLVKSIEEITKELGKINMIQSDKK